MSVTKKVSSALVAGTAAGIAAGYYFYASKNAKKNRRIVSKWATGLKTQVVKQAKHLKKFDRAAIMGAVDETVMIYGRVRDIDRSDIERAASELKNNWKKIANEIRRPFRERKPKVRKYSSRKSKK